MENNYRNIEDRLSKIPKDSGFEVPQGYFDQVEDDFSFKLKEEIIPTNSGFDLPEGYFESLEDRILEKVELPKKGKIVPLRTRIARFSSAAAAVVLLFASYLIVYSNGDPDLTSDEVIAWIDENIEIVSTEDIVDAFDEDTDLEDTFVFDNDLENDIIDKYLDENDTYILIKESEGLFEELN